MANGAPDQRFALVDPDTGFTRIRNHNSGLILGITDGSKKPGALVVQWPDTGAADRRPVTSTIRFCTG